MGMVHKMAGQGQISYGNFSPAPANFAVEAPAIELLYQRLALTFWVWTGCKPLTILLFANDPAQATLIEAVVDAFFLLAVTIVTMMDWMGGVPRLLRPRSLAAAAAWALVAWSAITLLWLPAVLQGAAFGYWGLLFADLAVMALLLRAMDTARIVTAVAQGFAGGTSAFALATLLMVGSAEGRLGDSELLHPNMLGAEFSVGLLFALWLLLSSRSLRARGLYAILSCILGLALALTLSKTSLAAAAIALVVLFLNLRVRTAIKAAALFVFGTAAFLCLPWFYAKASAVADLQQVDTLSGRTELWGATWQMIAERPWSGYGFMSFRDIGPQIFPGMRLVHAHNEWLNTWFSLGILGAVLLAVLYGSVLKNALQGNASKTLKMLVLPVLTFLLIRSMTEVNIGSSYGLPFLYLFARWEKSDQ